MRRELPAGARWYSRAHYECFCIAGAYLFRFIWICWLVDNGTNLTFGFVSAEVVGSVTGLNGFASGLAGAGFTVLVGMLVDHFSYFPAFVLAAMAPILATCSILRLLPSK